MNEKPEIKPAYVTPLKKICMTIGELPSSYLETMSYYEMLVWFTEFMKNTMIPTINNNGEAVQELQNLYEELRIYVNTYKETMDNEIENFETHVNNTLEAFNTYMTTYLTPEHMQPLVNNSVNELIQTGVVNVATTYDDINERLDIVITEVE